jgi:hypothetical protein
VWALYLRPSELKSSPQADFDAAEWAQDAYLSQGDAGRFFAAASTAHVGVPAQNIKPVLKTSNRF